MWIKSSEIKRLPGLKNAWRCFCVHPDGSMAYLYDNVRSGFVELDLTTGKQTLITTEPKDKSETDEYTTTMYDLIASIRLSTLFILVLILQRETGKMYAASFYLNNAEKKMCFVDKQYICTCTDVSPLYFHKDESGEIYTISYHFNEASCILHVSRVNMDERGKILITILAANRSVMGNWCAPFIHSRSLHFLPHGGGDMTKMLHISLNSEESFGVSYIEIDAEAVTWVAEMSRNRWVRPQLVNENIFYYASRWKADFLLNFDWNNQRWRCISIDIDEHQIGDNRGDPKLVLDANGSVYLHGNCRLKNCNEEAHIYIIQSRSYETLPFLNQAPEYYKDLDVRSRILDIDTSAKETLNQSMNQTEESSAANTGDAETSSSASYDSAIFDHPLLNRQNVASSDPESQHQHNKGVPNEYDKLAVLGEGHFGIVYKCWDAERRRFFIAKWTKFKTMSIKSSLNEVKRLEHLHHPRIIDYYGYKFEDNKVVIFMEYMPLGSIRNLIKKHGPVAEETALFYITQVLDGLAYLHSKGIVHNDLKCDNLLSDHNGNIKIGDFGLAVQKYLDAQNESCTNPNSEILGGGSVFWTAPEFFESETISRKSDIWSLGCTIVEMLTTKPPYAESNSQIKLIIARAQNLLSYDPKELVPGVAEEMQNFIGRLLQIDCRNRPADANEAYQIFCTLFK